MAIKFLPDGSASIDHELALSPCMVPWMLPLLWTGRARISGEMYRTALQQRAPVIVERTLRKFFGTTPLVSQTVMESLLGYLLVLLRAVVTMTVACVNSRMHGSKIVVPLGRCWSSPLLESTRFPCSTASIGSGTLAAQGCEQAATGRLHNFQPHGGRPGFAAIRRNQRLDLRFGSAQVRLALHPDSAGKACFYDEPDRLLSNAAVFSGLADGLGRVAAQALVDVQATRAAPASAASSFDDQKLDLTGSQLSRNRSAFAESACGHRRPARGLRPPRPRPRWHMGPHSINEGGHLLLATASAEPPCPITPSRTSMGQTRSLAMTRQSRLWAPSAVACLAWLEPRHPQRIRQSGPRRPAIRPSRSSGPASHPSAAASTAAECGTGPGAAVAAYPAAASDSHPSLSVAACTTLARAADDADDADDVTATRLSRGLGLSVATCAAQAAAARSASGTALVPAADDVIGSRRARRRRRRASCAIKQACVGAGAGAIYPRLWIQDSSSDVTNRVDGGAGCG